MIAWLDRVFLAADSALWICHAPPFWFAKFLMKNPLVSLWGSFVCDNWQVTFLLLLSKFFFVFDIWSLNCNVSQCNLFPIFLICNFLSLMNLDVHLSLHVWEFLSHYCFKSTLCPFIFSPCNAMMCILFLLIISHKPHRMFLVFFFTFVLVPLSAKFQMTHFQVNWF